MNKRENSAKVLRSMETQIAVIANDVSHIKEKVVDIDERLEKDYVTQAEFDPIKKLVYGTVGLVLSAFVAALIALVIT